MGSWSETCLVTRIPILAGDNVTMVVVAKHRDPYKLTDFTMARTGIERIEYGIYDDYGWLAGLAGAHSPQMTERPEPYERSLFCHQTVWAEVVAYTDVDSFLKNIVIETDVERRRLVKLYEEHNLPDPPDHEFWQCLYDWLRVLRFCMKCRINPGAGLVHKGQQDDDFRDHEQLLAITNDQCAGWRRKVR